MGRTLRAGGVEGETEGDFRSELTRKLRATLHEGYRPMVVPIETGSTMVGVSDLYVKTRRATAWMELKRLRKAPGDSRWSVPFRPGQRQFLAKNSELGGVSVLGVATPLGSMFFFGSSIREAYEAPYQGLRLLRQGRLNAKELLEWIDLEAEHREL